MARSLLAPRRGEGEDEDGSYLASVSDLMVGMLFVFIIILMAFALNFRVAEQDATQIQWQLTVERDALSRDRDALSDERDRLAQERDELAAERDDLGAVTDRLLRHHRIRSAMLAAVVALLRARQVDVSLEPENGILRLPESLLFDSAQAVLRPEGVRALHELAAALARSLPCYSRAPEARQTACRLPPQPLLEAVLIEGHTDEVPISTSRFEDNWQLASARAINTYKALLSYEPSLAALRNARGEALLGVGGYEAHRPVSLEPTPEGRRLNRRIDLRFLIAAPSEDQLGAMRREVNPGLSP